MEQKAAEGVSEHKSAFDRYIKTGVEAGLEAKGIAEDTATTGGGWLAPPQTEQAVTLRIQHSSPMRDICQVQTISSSVYRKVFSTTGAAASWAAETGARAETTAPVLSNLDIPCADLYAVPAATQSLLNDALINIDDWLARECEDAFAYQETLAFISGNGTNQPKGLLSSTIAADSASLAWGTLGYIASGVSASITSADAVQDLIYAPRPRFRANGRFIFNKKTTAVLRKLKDTTNQYIWAPPAEAGKPASLFGYPVTEVETMPDPAANSYSIAFGDFEKGYLIVDRAGISVLRDPFTAKPYVLFYTTKRVGGAVQVADAIKLMKFSAT
jgi:HK97 family phage major capsid protein